MVSANFEKNYVMGGELHPENLSTLTAPRGALVLMPDEVPYACNDTTPLFSPTGKMLTHVHQLPLNGRMPRQSKGFLHVTREYQITPQDPALNFRNILLLRFSQIQHRPHHQPHPINEAFGIKLTSANKQGNQQAINVGHGYRLFDSGAVVFDQGA